MEETLCKYTFQLVWVLYIIFVYRNQLVFSIYCSLCLVEFHTVDLVINAKDIEKIPRFRVGYCTSDPNW